MLWYFSSLDHGDIYRDIYREARKYPNLKKLYVSQIPPHIHSNELYDIMKNFGNIRDCRVIEDHHRRQSRGYGFVEFDEAEAAARVLDRNIIISDHIISITLADTERGRSVLVKCEL